jgi:hypothetical protein
MILADRNLGGLGSGDAPTDTENTRPSGGFNDLHVELELPCSVPER